MGSALATTRAEGLVRAQILSEHHWLRDKLTMIESSLRRIEEGEAREADRLRVLVRDLADALRRHLESEEQILLPILSMADEWGTLRVERVRTEHVEQRSQITTLVQLATGGALGELSAAIRAFGRALRADMRMEEQSVLSPDFLRDDIVTFDKLDG